MNLTKINHRIVIAHCANHINLHAQTKNHDLGKLEGTFAKVPSKFPRAWAAFNSARYSVVDVDESHKDLVGLVSDVMDKDLYKITLKDVVDFVSDHHRRMTSFCKKSSFDEIQKIQERVWSDPDKGISEEEVLIRYYPIFKMLMCHPKCRIKTISRKMAEQKVIDYWSPRIRLVTGTLRVPLFPN